jgi:membrane-associated phospholipid phosphatase
MKTLFRPADKLTLSALALFAILALAGGSRSAALAGLYLVLALLVLGSVRYRTTRPDGPRPLYVSTAAAVLTVLFLFSSLGTLIDALRHQRYDSLLIAIDYALFGVHPTVWMERFITPTCTAILQIAYISYYAMPIALAVTLIVHAKHAEFETAWFGIVLCFYLSYLGYLLVPAIGPRFTLESYQTTPLRAGPFITALQQTLNSLEKNKTDAFPSGHTAIALVNLYYAGKMREKLLFGILLPLVVALIVSTVYLRYHYVVDVMAGMVLAGLTIVLAPYLERLLSSAGREPAQQRHDRG